MQLRKGNFRVFFVFDVGSTTTKLKKERKKEKTQRQKHSKPSSVLFLFVSTLRKFSFAPGTYYSSSPTLRAAFAGENGLDEARKCEKACFVGVDSVKCRQMLAFLSSLMRLSFASHACQMPSKGYLFASCVDGWLS
jgi:hypothetical protein